MCSPFHWIWMTLQSHSAAPIRNTASLVLLLLLIWFMFVKLNNKIFRFEIFQHSWELANKKASYYFKFFKFNKILHIRLSYKSERASAIFLGRTLSVREFFSSFAIYYRRWSSLAKCFVSLLSCKVLHSMQTKETRLNWCNQHSSISKEIIR